MDTQKSNGYVSGKYEKVKDKLCVIQSTKQYRSLLVAKMDCDSNPHCFGIYDNDCKGTNYKICFLYSSLPDSIRTIYSPSNWGEQNCLHINWEKIGNDFYCNDISLS